MLDEIGSQLVGHMRWANQQMFAKLATLPDSALELHEVHDDWTVARIANHLVGVSGRLVARCTGGSMVQDGEIPTSASDFEVLASRLLESDSALVDLATQPDQLCTFELFGASVTQPRSVLLAQAIHHAETHRTQIAGILANHGLDVINLDHLSLWYFTGAVI